MPLPKKVSALFVYLFSVCVSHGRDETEWGGGGYH